MIYGIKKKHISKLLIRILEGGVYIAVTAGYTILFI